MRLYSVYQILCLCGEKIESREAETKCEKCGRLIDVTEWGKR